MQTSAPPMDLNTHLPEAGEFCEVERPFKGLRVMVIYVDR